jgi:hypothetical protein
VHPVRQVIGTLETLDAVIDWARYAEAFASSDKMEVFNPVSSAKRHTMSSVRSRLSQPNQSGLECYPRRQD